MKKIKQTLNLFTIAIIAIILTTSCGGGNKEKETTITTVSVKPKTTVIKGDLGEYYQVVDKEYQIKFDANSISEKGIITVEVKRNDKTFPFSVDKVSPMGISGGEDYNAGFGIEIFSDAGPEVIKSPSEGGMGGVYSHDDIKGLLNLKKDETGFIRWSIEKSDILKTFQLTSVLQKVENSETSNNSSSSDETISTSGSENWDQMLDDYEKYTNEYIKFYKQAMKGDASALSEYPEMMEKATNLSESMQNAQNDNQLSAKQINRMVKIQTKMLQAASGN